MTFTRVSLSHCMTTLTAARDEVKHREREASEKGASSLAKALDSITAVLDAQLAEIQRQDKKLDTKAEALPGP